MDICRGVFTLEGDVRNTETLVLALGGGDNGCVADERVVNTRVRNQVGLELVEINVEGTVETKG